MAKKLKALLSIFLAVFMVASLIAIPSSAASVSLNKTSITLTKGYQTTLSVNGTSSKVTWSTGDKSIATVSSSGKVVGKAPGTTYIYAKVSGTTLKCKVKVVAAKITASSSNVTLDEIGATKTVTITVKGSHSGLTVGTTNKSVATASWVKPWDGDKIKIKITAKGEGTARIKVYLKNYPSTCYKYIDVTVDDGEEDELVILTNPQSVSVDAGNSVALQVYCSDQNLLSYKVANSKIANVTASSISGKYRNLTVKGLSAGTTTLRLYNKNDSSQYVDVKITVGSEVTYYELYTTKPTSTPLPTDKILTIQVNSYTNYYMVVPANYDTAYANTIVAQKFNKYSYYEVYTSRPSRTASTDTYFEFYHSNASYNYGARYVLLPANYDQVKLNTSVAKYNNKYEYYTVYNESPKFNDTWDELKTWTVIDSSTGNTINRYMIVPYNNYDQSKIDSIIEADKESNSAYSYYKVYNEFPIVNTRTDDVIMFTKNGKYRYMVVPKTGLDILKRNEAIKNDTGVYEPYIMYETSPTPNTANGEYVLSARYGTKYVYILCTYAQDSAAHELAWANISTAAPTGT
ncbi:MAG: Ig-like domain-containing protein [Oscillospiraceae bacterium]